MTKHVFPEILLCQVLCQEYTQHWRACIWRALGVKGLLPRQGARWRGGPKCRLQGGGRSPVSERPSVKIWWVGDLEKVEVIIWFRDHGYLSSWRVIETETRLLWEEEVKGVFVGFLCGQLGRWYAVFLWDGGIVSFYLSQMRRVVGMDFFFLNNGLGGVCRSRLFIRCLLSCTDTRHVVLTEAMRMGAEEHKSGPERKELQMRLGPRETVVARCLLPPALFLHLSVKLSLTKASSVCSQTHSGTCCS